MPGSSADPRATSALALVAGNPGVSAWQARLSLTAQANLHAVLDFLKVQPLERWKKPRASSPKDDVYEIHFHDESRVRHRISGFYDPQGRAFVMCDARADKARHADAERR